MEDAHICLPELDGTGSWRELALFGVMDGHGGEQVAKFAERHLPEELCACELSSASANDEISHGLRTAFHRIDDRLRDFRTSAAELRSLTNKPCPEAAGHIPAGIGSMVVSADTVGCTCCLCCITAGHIICANAGDSRAVLCRGGRAVALSEDHKPNLQRERQRIAAAGGYVEEKPSAAGSQFRVNGNLNLSRALGDLEYKRDTKRGPEAQIISGTPDIEVVPRTAEDEFVVVCCDGVWDVKTNQQVVDYVRQRLPKADGDPKAVMRILEDLLDECVSRDLQLTRGLGSDNMTAVLVLLPQPSPEASGDLRVEQITLEEPGSDGFGRMRLRVELPETCTSIGDVELLVREQAAELRVIVGGNHSASDANGTTNGTQEITVDLEPHLPSGAAFCFGDAVGHAVTAKFHKRQHFISARLPWRKGPAAA